MPNKLTPKFPLGQTVMTQGIAALVNGSIEVSVELGMLMARHHSGDWGDVHPEDVGANERALEHGSRLMSVYELRGQKVWIITEADRSVTTALLPDEY